MNIEDIIRKNIVKTIHLSLATVSENKPWVSEVHFAYDKQLNIYFRSKVSRRHSQEIAANPNVSGNIIKQHELGEYPLGVYFEGVAEQLRDVDESHLAYQAISKRFSLDSKIIDDANNDDGHKFYKISVSAWYVFGAFDDQGGQKYELPWPRL